MSPTAPLVDRPFDAAPALAFAPELLLRAQGVRALALSAEPGNALDRFGLHLLQQCGVAVYTGALQPSALRSWLQLQHLNASQLAVLGHDWADLPALQMAGFRAATADAHAEVRARADWVADAGVGSVRALCDLLLTAQGRYADLLSAHLNGRAA